MEQLKYRDSYICFKEEFGKMGSLSEAVIYAPEKISSLVSDFWKSYTDLPEVLKRQGLNDENKAWFLQSICWSKQQYEKCNSGVIKAPTIFLYK